MRLSVFPGFLFFAATPFPLIALTPLRMPGTFLTGFWTLSPLPIVVTAGLGLNVEAYSIFMTLPSRAAPL